MSVARRFVAAVDRRRRGHPTGTRFAGRPQLRSGLLDARKRLLCVPARPRGSHADAACGAAHAERAGRVGRRDSAGARVHGGREGTALPCPEVARGRRMLEGAPVRRKRRTLEGATMVRFSRRFEPSTWKASAPSLPRMPRPFPNGGGVYPGAVPPVRGEPCMCSFLLEIQQAAPPLNTDRLCTFWACRS